MGLTVRRPVDVTGAKQYQMKSRNIAHLFVSAALLSWLVVLGELAAHEAICNSSTINDVAESGVDKATTGKAWMDGVGDQFQRFLSDKIFGQENVKEATADSGFLSHLDRSSERQQGSASGQDESSSKQQNPLLSLLDFSSDNPIRLIMENILDFGKTKDGLAAGEPTSQKQDIVFSLLEKVQHLDEDKYSPSGTDFFKIVKDALTSALVQLKAAFGDILDEVNPSIALSMNFFLATEDARKNPSWKRQQHRFYDDVSKEMILEMHDALYLSQVAYMNSLDAIRKQLSGFQNNEWELAYGTTDSLPHMPAHFLMLHKRLAPLAAVSMLPWEGKERSELTAVLVVRGTKGLADVLADTMLLPVEYRNGHAHGGILENGKNLARQYLPKLKALLEHSGRQKIRLFLVGHSLGAAAAAIAAMEFHDHDWIKVESIGFGCPSLLSRELSETTKDYITTVVADSDMVPRMSGASVANLLLDLLEFDWTDMALEDIEFTMDRAAASFPFSHLLPSKDVVLDWVKGFIEKEIKPTLKKEKRKRLSNVLIPPGACIHLYRDGVGYSTAYTPCSFFTSIDLTRTLIDDHLVVPGYHRAMLTVMRDRENDFNVRFSIPANVESLSNSASTASQEYSSPLIVTVRFPQQPSCGCCMS
jgi:Lipase (class 3)